MIFTDNTNLNSQLLGLKIRKARERQGLSQEELAAEMGIGQRGISELENGKRRLAVTEVPLLAMVLDVPFMYFFSDTDQRTEYDAVLLEAFHQLPSAELQEMVIEMVRLLSKTLSK